MAEPQLETLGDGVKGFVESSRESQWIHAFMRASPDCAILVDSSQQILFANRAVEHGFGYSPEELIGQPIDILVPEAARGSHAARVDKFLRHPNPVEISSRGHLHARHKTGREVPVEIGLTPVRLGGNTLVITMVRDITHRVRAAERLRLLVQSAPVAMILVNDAGRISMVNSEAERVFGYSHDETRDQAIEMLIPDRYHDRHPDYVRSFFRDAQPRKLGIGRELHGRRKDGSEFPVELALGPVEIEGKPFAVATAVDITDRKRLEQDLQLARRIQEALLPEKPPQLADFDIAGACQPAHMTGGDFFDYVQLPEERLVIVLGDATGHGFGPALLTASTRTRIRTLLHTMDDLPRVIEATNDLLVADTLPDQFVTGMLVELDPRAKSFAYYGAGHDGYLFDSRGEMKQHLDSSGPPFGIVSQEEYPVSSKIALEPGDLLLLATDGVYESWSPTGQQFGKERVFNVIRSSAKHAAKDVISELQRALIEFSQGCRQEDDVTVVAVKVVQ